MNAINAEVYYGQVAIGSNKQILTLKIDIGNPVYISLYIYIIYIYIYINIYIYIYSL